ncbi:MAG: beta-ketoacyl synthase N-terminal-like domain-containing protein, partial [Kiritimatiellales bacterium]
APLPLVMGICSGAVDLIEQAKETVMTRGANRVKPYIVGSCQPHAISAAMVQMLGVQTSVTTISSACPSGLDSVAAAFRMIKEGRADIVIVGAADSPLNIATMASFYTAGLLSVSTDFPPEEISRPFDAKRSGTVAAEGAGFLILERLDSAIARSAAPYMEILGGATVTDSPGSPGMSGLFESMGMAMINAGVYEEQIDYIFANAVSDLHSDRVETEWIKKRFRERAYQIPVVSIRGVMGHPLAPAGMFQMIASALSLQHQIIIPTANLHYPDPFCDLDYVPLQPRHSKLDIVMANGHGMGGENSTVIVKRVV